MDDNLVGYLLHALDPDTERQVAGYVREDPEARKRLQLLRQALEPLAADHDSINAPPGLALRTLGRVAEYRCGALHLGQTRVSGPPFPGGPGHLPQAPAGLASRPGAPGRGWRRRADVLVAAGLLLAVLLCLPIAISYVREVHARTLCANNLRLLHQALTAYSHNHNGRFPRVEEQPPRNLAGMIIPILNDAGVLSPDVSVNCPAFGRRPPDCRSLEQLEAMSPEQLHYYVRTIAFSPDGERLACYSYALGYRDPFGALRGYQRDDDGGLPIMADRPLLAEEGAGPERGNSPNHGGGQNVLFIGGHVGFFTQRVINGDDIYLNEHGQVAAGVRKRDSVLGASADRP